MDLTPESPEPFEDRTEADLEEELLAATSNGTSGRVAQARVTAIRTVLRVRAARRRADSFDADHARALELVNATRGPDRQLTEVHPVDVATLMGDPSFAELVVSDEEMERFANGGAGPSERTNG